MHPACSGDSQAASWPRASSVEPVLARRATARLREVRLSRSSCLRRVRPDLVRASGVARGRVQKSRAVTPGESGAHDPEGAVVRCRSRRAGGDPKCHPLRCLAAPFAAQRDSVHRARGRASCLQPTDSPSLSVPHRVDSASALARIRVNVAGSRPCGTFRRSTDVDSTLKRNKTAFASGHSLGLAWALKLKRRWSEGPGV